MKKLSIIIYKDALGGFTNLLRGKKLTLNDCEIPESCYLVINEFQCLKYSNIRKCVLFFLNHNFYA